MKTPNNVHRRRHRPSRSLALTIVVLGLVPPAWSRAGTAPAKSGASLAGQRASRKTGTKTPRLSKPVVQPRFQSAGPSSKTSSIRPKTVQSAQRHSARETGSVQKRGRLVLVSSTNASLLGKQLPWNTKQAFSRSSAKVLVADRCVVEISKGTTLAFVENHGPCGQVLLLSGKIRVWPSIEIDVAGRKRHLSLRRPAEVWLGPTGPRSRAIHSPPGAAEPLPSARVEIMLDPETVFPHSKHASQGLSFGSQESVSSVGGGSMCLDTTGGSGAAGAVQQGPTTIQKPTPKARVILQVEVSR